MLNIKPAGLYIGCQAYEEKVRRIFSDLSSFPIFYSAFYKRIGLGQCTAKSVVHRIHGNEVFPIQEFLLVQKIKKSRKESNMNKHQVRAGWFLRVVTALLALLCSACLWTVRPRAAGIIMEGDDNTFHPNRYVFQPGLSSQMQGEPWGVTPEELEEGSHYWGSESGVNSFVVPAREGRTGYGVLYTNVGNYRLYDSSGKVQETIPVDLRMTCTELIHLRKNWYTLDGSTWVGPGIRFYKNRIGVSIQAMEAAAFRYEFLVHGTETPLTSAVPGFGGHATFVDLDSTQKIGFPDGTNLDAVYKLKGNEHLQVTDSGTALVASTEATDPSEERGWLTMLYSGDFSLTFYYNTRAKYQTDDNADKQCVINPKVGAAYYGMEPGISIGSWMLDTHMEKRAGAKGVSWEQAVSCGEPAAAYPTEEYREFDYLIRHEVTQQKHVVKYEFSDTLEACLDIDGPEKVRVLDRSGQDVTGKFDVLVEEDGEGRKRVLCSARTEHLSTEAFFRDESYTFCLTVHRRRDMDAYTELQPWRQEQDGILFYVPNQAELSWAYAGGMTGGAQSDVCWVLGKIGCELEITKSAAYDGWQVGSLIDYTVTVTQTRRDGYARNVTVTDQDMPAGLRFHPDSIQAVGQQGQTVSLDMAGDSGWQVSCPLLRCGESLTIAFCCEALEAGNGRDNLNTASAAAENFWDGDGNARTASAQAEVWINSPKLTLEKLADHYEWQVGQPVTYQVVVKNMKDYTIAENVMISDLNLPEGLVLAEGEGAVELALTPESIWEAVDVPVPDGTAVLEKSPVPNETAVLREGNGWRVSLARLPSQATAVVTFHCIATEARNGLEVQNQAFVTASNAQETADDARVYINSAALAVGKSADHYEWQVGDLVEYRVTVTNTNVQPGPSIARNVDVYDMEIPRGLVLIEGEDAVQINGIPDALEEYREVTADTPNMLNPELYGERAGKGISWEMNREENGWHLHLSDLPAGYPVEILFRCQAMEEMNGTEAVNTASVTAQNSPPAQDETRVYVNTAALSIRKEMINPWYQEGTSRLPDEFHVGEEILYQVTLRNMQRGSIARNVVLEDLTLPQGVVLADMENPVTIEGLPASVMNPVPEDGTGSLEHYRETVSVPVTYSLEYAAGGYILHIDQLPCTQGDELNQYTQPLVITCHCVASQEVDGWKIVNTARAYADNAPEVSSSAKVWINTPVLQVEKKADKESYGVGDTITYALEVTQGMRGCVARNVVIEDVIDTPGVKLQKNSIVLLDGEGRRIEPALLDVQENSFRVETGRSLIQKLPYLYWDAAQGGLHEMRGYNPAAVVLEPGMRIEYAVEVVDPSLAGTQVHNTAVVNCDEDAPVQAEAEIEIRGAVLEMEKETDKIEYKVGETGSFRLVVRQLRDGVTAKNVVLQDELDTPGVRILPESLVLRLNGRECTPLSVEWGDRGFHMATGLNLGFEDKLELWYDVSYEEPSLEGRTIINHAVASGENTPPAGAEKQVQVGKTEEPAPVLEIRKTSDKTQYKPCETGHYQVEVTQTAKDAIARKVIIQDRLGSVHGQYVPGSLRMVKGDGTEQKAERLEETETGYEIHTGIDLACGESLFLTYDVKFAKEIAGKEKVPNEARAAAENLVSPDEEGELLWVKTVHEAEVVRTLVPSPAVSPTPFPSVSPRPTGNPRPTATLQPTASPRPTGQPRPTVTLRPGNPGSSGTGISGGSSGSGYGSDGSAWYSGGKTASAAKTGDQRPFAVMAAVFGIGCLLLAAGAFLGWRKKR